MSYNLNINVNPTYNKAQPFNVNVNNEGAQKPTKLYINPYESIEIKPKQKTIDSFKKQPSFIKKIGKKALSSAKKIRPGHVMFIAMFGMTCFARFGMNATNNGAKQSSMNHDTYMSVEKAYQQGAQHVRDSIAYAEVLKQNQILQDSIKQLKNLPK